jgi:hypothetical protein
VTTLSSRRNKNAFNLVRKGQGGERESTIITASFCSRFARLTTARIGDNDSAFCDGDVGAMNCNASRNVYEGKNKLLLSKETRTNIEVIELSTQI